MPNTGKLHLLRPLLGTALVMTLAMFIPDNTALAQSASSQATPAAKTATSDAASTSGAPSDATGSNKTGDTGTAKTAAPAPAPHCDSDHMSLCEDTNELIWSKGFADKVGTFVGPGTASWLADHASRIDQMIQVLSGPPQMRQKIGDDLWLYGACRAHSCPEKGAVIVTNKGEITATAILHFACTKTCQDDYTLTILGPKDDKTLTDAIKNWAQTTIDDDAREFKKASPPKIVTVEHLAPGAPAKDTSTDKSKNTDQAAPANKKSAPAPTK
ncbi:hypothetical protein TH25_07905 [Thalassospira profundimaris]|uniref:Uncharacterized protein n=1 Tax=Thalassospira profundimaris TaxID=502049 RepID=A0A367XDB0_9PROT|nr:hypothetical protein TH25_07905 [Thalassospira profundimaris]